MNDLELAPARRLSRVDTVLPLSRYQERLRQSGRNGADLFAALALALKERRVRRAEVPSDFPAGGRERLEADGLRIGIRPDPFLPERSRKSPREVRAIGEALRATEAGLARAVLMIASSVAGRDGRLRLDGEILTAERIREAAERTMFVAGAVAERSIVAGGAQGADPHERGSGPLPAGRPIVLDFFPRSRTTGYYGDLTRTVVKGRADERTRAAFRAVTAAQALARRAIRHGAEASEIHRGLVAFLAARGFPTRRDEKVREGFFHGTGHGLGLDLHEHPGLGHLPCRLEAGQVITIEPGVYYRDLGGIRVEDVVQVTRTGNRRLSRFPNFLEIP